MKNHTRLRGWLFSYDETTREWVARRGKRELRDLSLRHLRNEILNKERVEPPPEL